MIFSASILFDYRQKLPGLKRACSDFATFASIGPGEEEPRFMEFFLFERPLKLLFQLPI